jgi:tetratricopeptide (TPR) repeat protein
LDVQPAVPNFFISYNKADLPWAEWIAWQLEAAGYTSIIQAWDFRPGSNFVLDMQRAATEAERTIAVLSPDYLVALYTQPEWAAAFAQDPTGEKGTLLPVRVRACELKGLLSPIVYIDLVGRDAAAAKQALLAGAKRGRAKPANEPDFPAGPPAAPPAKPEPRFPGSLPRIWNVPHRRNPNFTGREDDLRELRAALTNGHAAAIVPIAGLGGAGKTQLALEYAWRHTADYDAVWWLRAEDSATLVADCAQLATPLGLPERGLADQQASAAAVLAWLGRHPGWLLIFDNARSAATCRAWLPAAGMGHVILTSRDPNWREVARPLRLPVLPPAEAVAFLQKRSGVEEPAVAGELCDALGNLPLALELAAAYIEANGISIADYLERYRGAPRELLTDAVAATWEISIEQLRTETDAAPAALELLNLIAFLAPDDIDPRLVAGRFPDALQLDRARAGLLRYSLIEARGGTISVHRLVQAATRARLVREGLEQEWAEAAANLVDDAFPFDPNKVETWSASARLLPHALAAAGHSESLGAALETTGRLLNEVGLYLLNRAQLAEAERSLKRALAVGEEVYGPEHPKVAIRANNIGQILKAQGDLAGAMEYTRRALAIGEKVYGPDHPTVAIRANNIGTILQDQGDLAGALEYTRRALAIGEKVYSPDHPMVAIWANNIGMILKDQGDLAGALEYTRRALAIDEKVYGPDHPNVARDANNIGQILKAQGDLEGALEYTRRALAIDERVDGPDHPTVATLANNIGQILKAQGDLAGALEYTRRALAIDEKVYGTDHPNVARDANNIGQILKAQGDLAGALEYTRRALVIDEKVYGPDHPEVATDANNIGQILKEQGDLAGASEYTRRALRILQATYGPENPGTKIVAENLARIEEAIQAKQASA